MCINEKKKIIIVINVSCNFVMLKNIKDMSKVDRVTKMMESRNAARDDKYTYVSELRVHRCSGADAAFKREKSKKRVKYVSDT